MELSTRIFQKVFYFFSMHQKKPTQTVVYAYEDYKCYQLDKNAILLFSIVFSSTIRFANETGNCCNRENAYFPARIIKNVSCHVLFNWWMLIDYRLKISSSERGNEKYRRY